MPSKSSSSSGSCASHVAQFLVAVLALVGALNAFVTQPTLLHHTDAFPPAQWRGKYGPWAVVAGASKGLGREWVVQCAARGLNVVAIARNAKELELTKAEALKANASVKIELVAMDLANSEAVLEYSTKLAKEREVGLLIYNAAMGAPGEFLSQAFKYHKLTFDVNVYSMLAMVHSFAAPMVARKHGGIVIVGSMAGELGNAWVSTYGGTKSLQRNFVEALWWELKRYGVDVLLPLLGPTTTDALQVMKEDLRKQRLMEQSPEEVVTETMHALGRGVPTLSTGLFGKFSWILLRYVPVPWMAEIANGNMVDVYRSQEELDAITKKGASGPTSG